MAMEGHIGVPVRGGPRRAARRAGSLPSRAMEKTSREPAVWMARVQTKIATATSTSRTLPQTVAQAAVSTYGRPSMASRPSVEAGRGHQRRDDHQAARRCRRRSGRQDRPGCRAPRRLGLLGELTGGVEAHHDVGRHQAGDQQRADSSQAGSLQDGGVHDDVRSALGCRDEGAR